MLDIKYRPKTLEEILDNTTTKNYIKSLIENDSLPKSLIIYGSNNGIGKSSLAYVISRILNCENPINKTTPCQVCRKCQLMDKMYLTGEAVSGLDIFKFDIGLKSSSEYINQIINVIKQPLHKGRKRIIHIDEIQLLSLNEQEKLNNPLEFCPENCLILMTTTNVSHIAKSIKSRSIMLNIETPSKETLINRTLYILAKEGQAGLLSNNEIKQLVCLSENPRHLLRTLNDIINSGKDRFIELYNTMITNDNLYIDYFSAIDNGIISLVDFIENLKEPTNFIKGLGSFLYKAICTRYGTTKVFSQDIQNLFKYNDKELVDVIKLLSTTPINTDYKAKEILMVIGFDLSSSLLKSITTPDRINDTMTNKEVDTDVVNTLNIQASTFFGTTVNKEDL